MIEDCQSCSYNLNQNGARKKKKIQRDFRSAFFLQSNSSVSVPSSGLEPCALLQSHSTKLFWTQIMEKNSLLAFQIQQYIKTNLGYNISHLLMDALVLKFVSCIFEISKSKSKRRINHIYKLQRMTNQHRK